MIKQSFLPLTVLLAFACSAVAATSVERDAHFWAVKRLIDKEMRLVVDPEVEAFKKASYPAGENYAKILRLHYCQIFQLDDPKLAAEIPELFKTVTKTQVPEIDAITNDEVNNGAVLRYVNPLLRDLLPDSPATPLGEEKKARVEKRVKLLTDKALEITTEFKKRIAANKADEEKYDLGEVDEKAGMVIIEKAVTLRLDYANEMYFTYLALREVIYRGDQFGIDTSDAEKFMVSMVGSNEQIEELSTWDWNYADYQIFLRHRIQVMLSDVVRRGHKYGDYGQVVAGFQSVMDTPLDSYPGGVRPFIEGLKLTALSDLLYWHVAMQKARPALEIKDAEAARTAASKTKRGMPAKVRPNYAEEGIKLFENYAKEMKLSDMLRRDKDQTNKVAQVYFVAGRLYRLANQVPKALELVAEISDIKPNHYYYGNARRWKSYYVTPDTDQEIDFYAPFSLVDPEKILDSIPDILSEARNTEDKKQRNKMYTGAAVSLRNAILSLQDAEYRRKWVKVGPTAYFQFAYVLYKLEKYEYAAVASLEGAQAYRDLYERRQNNPFKDDKGRANANMEGLIKLVQNLSPYSSQLRRIDKSEASTVLYRTSLKVLEAYREIVGDLANPKAVIIALIQEGNYKEALEKDEEYAVSKDLNPTDQIWAARIRAYIYYLLWEEASKGGADAIAKVAAKLETAIKTVDEVLTKHKDAKDVGEEASKAKQMIVSIQVGVAFSTEDYLKVLLTLDDEFWANPPEESSVLQKVAGQMCGASYKYHIVLLEAKDPQKTIEMWPHIKRAYMALNLAREKTGASLTNSSKALAETYKNIGKLADWFVESGSKAGVAEFNFAQMNKIVQQAPLHYGNLMMPVVLEPGCSPDLVRSVARTLQRGGDNERAAQLYEIYLKVTAENTKLMAFKSDPKDIVDRVGDVILAAPLGNIRRSWVTIRDLLVDKPGFVEGEYRRNGGTARELSELKVSYAEAVLQLDQLLADAKTRKAALGADFEKVVTAVSDLRDMAMELATYIQIMDYTVQSYLSINNMEKALPYIKGLIAYDPIHPRYRALNVEIVLRAIKGPNPPPKDEIVEARKITIDLMQQYKDKPDRLADFWLAYCQAYELTAVLGEIDNVNKSLKRHHNSDVTPIIFDLAADNGDGTFAARDQEGAALIKRYLLLYDIKGVTFPKPFELKMDDDQLIIKMVKE